MIRVFAIDPGLTRCGVAVVDGGPGQSVQMRFAGVVRTDPGDPLAERLRLLDLEFSRLVQAFSPDVAAVERVFSQHNVASAMATAQAAAVALLVAAKAGLPTAEHSPTQVKASVTGSGSAGKQQVSAMVCRVLGLAEAPRPVDATDALALAICHLWRIPMLARIEAAEVGR